MKTLPLLLLVLLGSLLAAGAEESRLPDKIEFNRDVRPILSNNCFKCHGFDVKERKGDRRLDTAEGAYAEKDGVRALVPGKLAESETWARINTTDPDDQMPPPKSGKHITDRDRAVLKRWIEQGAVYQPHWAYIAPVKGEIPAGKQPIDFLVQQKLKEEGLAPSKTADRPTLLRRLSFDLCGLPPTPAEVEAFVEDKSPDAYNKQVERLLASPHYGERMAMPWLDVVRFADTIGYHSDNPRNIWPYRDYVIKAFNDNKRFDQFTIEQVAGDLLPNASRDQEVASGFNRLLLSTEEGGAQAKDYEARMLTDRVRAIGTVWLGATIGCAQCHDHKFDPITSRDFYSMGAFFADIKEPIIGKRETGLALSTPEQESAMKAREAEVATIRTEFEKPYPGLGAEALAWDLALTPAQIAKLKKEVRETAALPLVFRTPAQRASMLEEYRQVSPHLADLRGKLKAAEGARDKLDAEIPKCLVSVHTNELRTVRLLPRGDWMNETAEIVKPALPHFLPQPPKPEGRELTRLDLAQWLVSRENPLTARVFVNRLWKQFFGIGLSKVLDDLGAQGEPPSDPALLDYLAAEFVDSGWDVKHLVLLIVSSHTYQQVSTASKELQARDPYNRELARQGRWRLDAEFVRDNALSVAGLLVPTIGGPSVKPYQPDGYWENLNFPPRKYDNASDQGEYRRGLYTWWQRSYLHPSLLAFDAPTREECTAERVRSNIPQQALALLNDPTYVEASRVFATRILAWPAPSPEERLSWAFSQALQRAPRPEETKTLAALFEKELEAYQKDPAAAEALLKVGNTPPPAGVNPAELAAWTNVARVIFNLSESITRS